MLDPVRLQRAFDLVRGHVATGQVPAAVLAVATSRETVRVEAFSGTDFVEVDSRFAVASITKPIVAAAVMQLVEAGQLVLDDPVVRYLPEFRPPPRGQGEPGGEAVTAWQILSHTSGMRDIAEPLERVGIGATRIYEELCRRPLASPPRAEYSYCSDSFYVLGELIRRLSGLPYPEYLRERLFKPLGMVSTSFDPGPAGARAPFHAAPEAEPATEDTFSALASLAHPGAGLSAPAGDVVAFGRAMLFGGTLDSARVLGRPFVELMTREQTAGILESGTPPREPRYALGWAKSGLDGSSPGSPAQFGHAGATGTRLWVDPAHDLVIVFLMNVWGAENHYGLSAVQALYGALD